MDKPIEIKTTSPSALIIAVTALACFALSPIAQAISPPPDGGYPRFNTAEGQNALLTFYHRRQQHSGRLVFAGEPHHWQPEYGSWQCDAVVQYSRCKYSRWGRDAFKQHHRHLEHGPPARSAF